MMLGTPDVRKIGISWQLFILKSLLTFYPFIQLDYVHAHYFVIILLVV